MRWPSPFRAFRLVAFSLVSVVLVAFVLSYWSFYTYQKRYFVSRDFRILSSIGAEIEDAVDTNGRLLAPVAESRSLTPPTAEDKRLKPLLPTGRRIVVPRLVAREWFGGARFVVPVLDYVESVRIPADFLASRAGGGPPEFKGAQVEAGLMTDAGRLLLQINYQIGSAGEVARDLTFDLAAAPLVRPILMQPAHRGVFDVILLATSNGEVLLAAGDRQDELHITR
jgi:hypothetical protein